MKKLLIFGISGLTGYKIANQTSSHFDVYGTFNKRPTEIPNCITSQLDITNENSIHELFSEIKPDIVINTTALHDVDFCEENEDKAMSVNAKAIQVLFDDSEKFGSKLVHISTDYVFDGNTSMPYKEDDNALPVNIYGKSKLEGEKTLKNTNHVVLRPSVIYGWTPLELAGTVSSSGKPMNFAIWLLSKLQKNEPLKIVTDQFASATLADSLAESAVKIAEGKKGGLFHVSGLSCESRYDFSLKLAKTFGYDATKISKTVSSQFKQKAKRPAFSCLNCEKAIQEFGLKLYTTEEALEIMKGQVAKEAPQFIKN